MAYRSLSERHLIVLVSMAIVKRINTRQLGHLGVARHRADLLRLVSACFVLRGEWLLLLLDLLKVVSDVLALISQ